MTKKKRKKFIFGFLLFSLLLSILLLNTVNADCRISGCSPDEKCMADGECTKLSVKEYCESHGFFYTEKLLEKNCSKEKPKERELLCKQCQGDYEYSKGVGNIKGIIYNVAAGIAILLLVIHGFKLLTSKDLIERQNAKKSIIFVILGLILLIIASALVEFVFLPPPPLPITTTTTLITTTTITSETTTTTPIPVCIGYSTCIECLANGCEWCLENTVGPPICTNDCDVPTCLICLKTTCETTTTTSTTYIDWTTTTTTSTTTTTTINVPCEDSYSYSCAGYCPSGKTCKSVGNTCECKEAATYTLLYIKVGGTIPGGFVSKAEESKNYWVEKTSLKNCPERVRALVETNRVCPPRGFPGDLDAVVDCANSWGYSGKYQKIVGVVDDIGMGVRGYTRKGSPSVISMYSPPGVTFKEVVVHELGHAQGYLCDEAYNWVPSCPNKVVYECIMYAWGPRLYFSPAKGDCYDILAGYLDRYCR